MIKTEDKKYYLKRNKEPYLAKTVREIGNNIDILSLNSILSILKELDYPFVIKEWMYVLKASNTELTWSFYYNMSPDRILSRYLAIMNLPAWKHYTYKDSNILNEI